MAINFVVLQGVLATQPTFIKNNNIKSPLDIRVIFTIGLNYSPTNQSIYGVGFTKEHKNYFTCICNGRAAKNILYARIGEIVTVVGYLTTCKKYNSAGEPIERVYISCNTATSTPQIPKSMQETYMSVASQQASKEQIDEVTKLFNDNNERFNKMQEYEKQIKEYEKKEQEQNG